MDREEVVIILIALMGVLAGAVLAVALAIYLQYRSGAM